MRVSLLVLEELLVLFDVGTAIEHRSLDLWHVLAEAGILVSDLECQLAGVAHDQNAHFAVDWLNLLECGQHEDRSLTKTGLGLAKDIGSEDGLRNTDLLDWRKMLEYVRPIVSVRDDHEQSVRPSST